MKSTSLAYLKENHPQIGDAFESGLRQAIEYESGLAPVVRELVMLAGYTVAGHGRAFRLHCARAFDSGATEADVRAAVLITLGASAGLEPVVDALRWIDEVVGTRMTPVAEG